MPLTSLHSPYPGVSFCIDATISTDSSCAAALSSSACFKTSGGSLTIHSKSVHPCTAIAHAKRLPRPARAPNPLREKCYHLWQLWKFIRRKSCRGDGKYGPKKEASRYDGKSMVLQQHSCLSRESENAQKSESDRPLLSKDSRSSQGSVESTSWFAEEKIVKNRTSGKSTRHGCFSIRAVE